jgi:hypothetical protein
MGWKWRGGGGEVQARFRHDVREVSVGDQGGAQGSQPDHNASSAMLTARPERRTLRVQVPVRELEARRRKGSPSQKSIPGERPVEGIPS